MKRKSVLTSLLLLWGAAMTVYAQTLLPSKSATLLVASGNTWSVDYLAHKDTLGVAGTYRKNYSVASSDNSWLTGTVLPSGLLVNAGYNATTSSRTGTLTITAGAYSGTYTVTQGANQVVSYQPTQLTVSSATATSQETAYENGAIANAYDNDVTTYYHSNWSSGTSFPVTLEFTLPGGSYTLSRMEYVPRANGTGIFGTTTISYSTNNGSTYKTAGTITFDNSTAAQSYTFNNAPTGVNKVRLSIANSASGHNFISASEIRFYDESASASFNTTNLFADALCTTLKSGVTQSTIDNESNTILKHLAQEIFDGEYDARWRVGTYPPYRPISDLRDNLLHTNHLFCAHENPTGIFFRAGETMAIIASGIPSGEKVSLEIFDCSPVKTNNGTTSNSYSLVNGLNIITPTSQGNGYVNYYTANYATASEVSLHIIDGVQNGVFRYYGEGNANNDDNALWKRILASAEGPIIDIVTPRVQVSAPLEILKSYCPTDGAALARIYDEVVRQSWDIMGYFYDNYSFTNHQYVLPAYSGMFADYTGAHASWGSFHEWARVNGFGIWGFAHELGHNTQISPFTWSGMAEVTNNVCSAWAQYQVRSLTGNMDLSLEDESIDCVAGYLRCGRMQNFLDEDVLGTVTYSGLTNEYNGTTYTNDGAYWNTERTIGGGSTDVFVTLVPIWQMMLYTEVAGKSTDAFRKMYSDMRTNYSTQDAWSNEQKRLNWLGTICDAAELNFFPFFEKAGMLKPLDNIYVSDYSSYVYNISAAQFAAMQTNIESKSYTSVPSELVYMNAYNMNIYRDNIPLTTTATVGTGCTAETLNGHNMVKIDNTVWTGAVGYETYDSSNNLLHATIFGLGDDALSSHYTHVIWKLSGESTTPAYIKAVGYDGTRRICYQP